MSRYVSRAEKVALRIPVPLPLHTMTTPSQPVPISSPRLAPSDVRDGTPASFTTSGGTPDLRALRAQYGGTPTRTNIPPRGAPATQHTGSPIVSLLPPSEGSPFRSSSLAVGGLSATRRPTTPASGTDTPPVMDLDGLPDEEKAKVLRRHLVSKDERQNNPGSDPETQQSSEDNSSKSRRSSTTVHQQVHREDTEPFPIPYHAPGADVT